MPHSIGVAEYGSGGVPDQSNTTALLREAAIFIPGCECNSPGAPSRFDRLISG